MAALVTSLFLGITPAHTATYLNPPKARILWNSGDLGFSIWAVAFSPDSSQVAAGGGWCSSSCHGEVLVFSSVDGSLIWRSPDFGDYVWSLAFSPDGSKLAIGGSFGRVFVYSTSNWSELWESTYLGGPIWSIAWSPDGTKLVVGTGGISKAVFLFSAQGSEIWSKSNLGGSIYGVAWLKDGSLIIVGVGWEDASGAKHGKLVALSPVSGVLEWSTLDLGGIVNAVATSPASNYIVVGGSFNSVMLFSSRGRRIWLSRLGLNVLSVAFSPDGTKVAVGSDSSHVIIINASNGLQLWDSGPVSSNALATTYSVAFSPDGTKLAVGTGGSHEVITFSGFGYGTVIVTPTPLLLRACFFDGSVNNCYSLGSESLKLYADPGKYIIKYYLLSMPGNTEYVGDVAALSNMPVSDVLNVAPSSTVKLLPPTNLTDFMGRITISAPHGSSATIYWGSESKSFTIPQTGNITVYAVPGNYHVVVKPSISVDIGNYQGFIQGNTLVKNISVQRGETVTLELKPSEVATLSIVGIPGSGVNITWSTGMKHYVIPESGAIRLTAAPGTYNIVMYPSVPAGVVGDATTFILEHKVSKVVKLDPGEEKVLTYFTVPKMAKITVTGDNGLIAVIKWGSGLRSLSIGAEGNVTVYAVPNTNYEITPVNLKDIIHGNTIGDISKLTSITLQKYLLPGSEWVVNLSVSNLTGKLEVRNPSPVGVNVVITWNGGREEVTVNPFGHVEYLAVPEKYSVKISPVPPNGILGDVEGYVTKYSKVTHESVLPGKTICVSAPEVPSPTLMDVRAPPGSTVIIEWGGGSKYVTVPDSGDVVLNVVPNAEYQLRLSNNVFTHLSFSIIGDKGKLLDLIATKVRVGSGDIVKLNFNEKLSASLATLKVRNSVNYGFDLTIRWGGGSESHIISAGTTKSFYMVPGEYTITVKPFVTETTYVVGNFSSFKSANTRRHEIELGSGQEETLEPNMQYLSQILISTSPGLRLVITWDGGEQTIITDSSGLTEVYAVPGNTYSIYVKNLPPFIASELLGDPNKIFETPIKKVNANTETINIKLGLADYLPKLRIINPSGSYGYTFTISWNGGSRTINLGPNDERTLYAVPGTFKVTIKVNSQGNLIGDVDAWNIVTTLTLKPQETRTCSAPKPPAPGSLKIKAPPNTHVTIVWGTKKETLVVPYDGTLSLLALPSKYEVLVQPPEILSNAGYSGVRGVPQEISYEVPVKSNHSRVVDLYKIVDSVGTLKLINNNPFTVNVVVSRSDSKASSFSVTLDAGGDTTIRCFAGTYVIYARMNPQENVVAASEASFTSRVNVAGGPITPLNIRFNDGLVTFTGASARITVINELTGKEVWSGIINKGEKLLLPAGTYAIKATAVSGYSSSIGIIGDVSHYVMSIPVDVNAGETYTVNFTDYLVRSASEVTLRAAPGSTVIIRWGSNEQKYVVPPDGVLKVRLIPDQEYEVLGASVNPLFLEAHMKLTPSPTNSYTYTLAYPYSPLFYAITSLAVCGALAVFYITTMKPKVYVEVPTDEITLDKDRFLEVRIINKGLLPANVHVSLEINGKKVIVDEPVKVKGRSTEVKRVEIPHEFLEVINNERE